MPLHLMMWIAFEPAGRIDVVLNTSTRKGIRMTYIDEEMSGGEGMHAYIHTFAILSGALRHSTSINRGGMVPFTHSFSILCLRIDGEKLQW